MSSQATSRQDVVGVYEALTDGFERPLRVVDLVYEAAERFPGLVPTRAQIEAERELKQKDKAGLEIAQGDFIARVLAQPRCGDHLIESMSRPRVEAVAALEEFRHRGHVDLGPMRVDRGGRLGIVTIQNHECLNAEDDYSTQAMEIAIDLVLLDDSIEVGALRGGPATHPKHAGRRIFGSGINLTHLYDGKISLVEFMIERELGPVSKMYRGHGAVADCADASEHRREKPWVAAVERFAIGGACQLLHVVDHVIATRGARLYLPARKEGIIPGASNLRLPRFVGDRAARQAILSGREWVAGEPDAAMLCDEVVAPEQVDGALSDRIEALTSSGLVNAAANRSALRVGAEPLDLFRKYMSVYAREQAYCHLSPALVRNLEQHWNADRRRL